MRTLRVRAVAYGLAVLVVALAGCTGDRVRPSDTLPPTSAPTPTATTEDLPGPPGYPFPTEALEYNEAGAVAFFTYYIDLLNKTAESLDSEPIRLLAGPDCFECQRQVDMYNADRAAGYQYQGGVISVTQSPVIPSLHADFEGHPEMEVGVDGQISEFVVLDNSGAPVPDRTYPVYQIVLVVVAKWFPAQTSWQVTSLSLDVQ